MKRLGIFVLSLVFLVGLSPALYAEQQAGTALPKGDQKFVKEAAMGGLFEVELGRLGSEKASSPEVKKLAQSLVEDHAQLNDKLKGIAAEKGISLPEQLDQKHQKGLDRLSRLSGDQFDREFMNVVLSDHRKDLSQFRKAAKKSKDPDLKSFAAETVPGLEHHFQMAKDVSAQQGKAGS